MTTTNSLKCVAAMAVVAVMFFLCGIVGHAADQKAGDRMVLTIKGIEYPFRWCPPGTFMMGSPASEPGRPQGREMLHEVTLTKGFWMLETEVTQEMWESVMGENPSHFKGGKLPVERVSRYDCQDFYKKLNLLDVAPKDYHFWLPTEAQWEYACRAGTTTPYHFGSVLNGDKANCDGNYPYGTSTNGKYLEKTSEASSYSANAWGLYDMHGNVWEWCADRYGDYDDYTTNSVTDPTGIPWGRLFGSSIADTSKLGVARGGSWKTPADGCRSAFRGSPGPNAQLKDIGIRLALVRE